MGPTKITHEDQQFNINFVGEVKKHPCLFDSNSSEYKQASVQDKAWQAVSAAMDESVDTCKKRWRNLRCCMTRYLKSIRDNNELTANVRRKPYYLYTHMQFVLPYLKVREEGASYEQDELSWLKPNSSAGEGATKQDDDEVEDPPEIETIDVQEDDHHQQLKESIIQSIKILPMSQESESHESHQQQHEASPAEATAITTTTYEIITATPSKQPRLSSSQQQTLESSSPPSSSTLEAGIDTKKDILGQRQYYTITGNPTHSANVSMPCFATNPMGQQTPSFAHHTNQPQLQAPAAQHFALIPGPAAIVNDADHNFFQSLIPDIQSMTMEQKRKLKIGILQLIDNILNT